MAVPQGDLDLIRQALVARRGALTERQLRVERDLSRQNEQLVGDSSDRAIQLENDEALQAISGAAQEELAAIEEALQRIETGQYGSCKRCGGAIEPHRLQAVPHAVTCRECANN